MERCGGRRSEEVKEVKEAKEKTRRFLFRVDGKAKLKVGTGTQEPASKNEDGAPQGILDGDRAGMGRRVLRPYEDYGARQARMGHP